MRFKSETITEVPSDQLAKLVQEEQISDLRLLVSRHHLTEGEPLQ